MDAPTACLRIRLAVPDDAEGVARLQHRSHTTSFRPFAPDAWVASRDIVAYRQTWRERLSTTEESRTTWVAVDAVGEIVGMASLIGPRIGAGGDRRSAELRNLHVHPERFGLGIGTRLWESVRAYLREQRLDFVHFDTIAANAPARRFFEAFGFRVVGGAARGVEGVPIVVYKLALDASEPREHRRRA
jgi:ribosomal protein S18 acetylase RimI-like enzyme